MPIWRATDNTSGVGGALLGLGLVALGEGDGAAARARFTESLAIAKRLGERVRIHWSLEGLAAVAVIDGWHEQAARLYGAASAGREQVGVPATLMEREIHEPRLAAVRAALGEEAFTAAWEAGRALSLEDAVRYAMEITESSAEPGLGRPAPAPD
jgi:hypothetical protein